MIRVLHVLGGLNRGGAETMVMNLYRNIDRTKVQFDFIIHTKEKQDYNDEILSLGGKIFTFPSFNLLNIFFLRKIWKSFFKTHPEYKILHSHVRSYASIYLPIAKKNGLITIIHSHSISNGKGVKSLLKSLLQLPLRKQADYCFACSEKAGKWLFGKRTTRQKKFVIVKNGIDLSKFEYDEEIRKKLRVQFGLTGRVVYASIGRLHKSKNHKFLLRVFKRIHARDTESRLLIVGDGPLRDSIKKTVDSLGLNDCVIMKESVSNVAGIYQIADCVLIPSKWEGLCMVAIEAQASGTYVICSDCVPADVLVTENIERLELNIKAWVEAANTEKFRKVSCVPAIKKAGYDIKETSKSIQGFYLSL